MFDIGWVWRMTPGQIFSMTLDEMFLLDAQYRRLREREEQNGR